MALLEALACGTPAIVSAEVERAVGVDETGAGWVADPRLVGEALARLRGLENAQWAVVRDAAATFAADYTWKAIGGRWEQLYDAASKDPQVNE
jgi:glycosyltransferase involved in cell wall biosynthesis